MGFVSLRGIKKGGPAAAPAALYGAPRPSCTAGAGGLLADSYSADRSMVSSQDFASYQNSSTLRIFEKRSSKSSLWIT